MTTDDELETLVEEARQSARQKQANPLLTRRFINAYARLNGCMESDPEASCDHRILARRTMEEFVARIVVETP